MANDNSSDGPRDPLSMSTDNTSAGRIADSINHGPIALVHEGMEVVDNTGHKLGKVDRMRMGDPNAATGQGMGWQDGVNTLDEVARGIFGPSGSAIPESDRQTYLRIGYIRIDGRGWFFDHDCYAAADQIDRVEGHTVHLNVSKDVLPHA
ncbi:MAG: hypothetical protein ACKOCK_05985 [Chloroflexota bacterium]